MSRYGSGLRVVAIGGSLREHSCSYHALEHVTALLHDLDCQVQTLDLRELQLPFCNGDNRDSRPGYPGVAKLRRSVSEAQAVVLATPEYHGGVSGVLKNALDLLSIEHLEGKIAGVIAVLGGTTSSNALNELARILRCCHAWVLPEYIAIARADAVFRGGAIHDGDLLKRFDRFAQSLVWSATRMSGSRTPAAFENKQTGVIHETYSSSLSLPRSGGDPIGDARSIG